MMCLSIRARLTDWGSSLHHLQPKRANVYGWICACYCGWGGRLKREMQREGPCTTLTPSLGFGFARSIFLVCLPVSDPLDLGKARSKSNLGR